MVAIRRLRPGEEALARGMFAMMVAVFAEDEPPAGPPLADADVAALLRRDSFWALAAVDGDAVIGGLTAHELPMTRSRSSELFIYDLAVREDRQRQGIGRALVAALIKLGQEAGVETAFVPADNDDAHALEFYRAVGGVPSPVTFFTFSS